MNDYGSYVVYLRILYVKSAAKAAEVQRELGKAIHSYGAIEADLNRLRSQYRSLERRLEQLEMDDDMSVVENMVCCISHSSLNKLIAIVC